VVVQLYAGSHASLDKWLSSPTRQAFEAALRDKLGEGAPSVRARTLDVSVSAKPYGLDSLRAFD
jgi:DNA-binding transcriptional ArsR family regulator